MKKRSAKITRSENIDKPRVRAEIARLARQINEGAQNGAKEELQLLRRVLSHGEVEGIPLCKWHVNHAALAVVRNVVERRIACRPFTRALPNVFSSTIRFHGKWRSSGDSFSSNSSC